MLYHRYENRRIFSTIHNAGRTAAKVLQVQTGVVEERQPNSHVCLFVIRCSKNDFNVNPMLHL